ncbi:MAG: aldo/keto reductase [Phycisphaerales bacterium]|nr:MAG: aldo/keto reductase [Phycisphaerales bacterium]
MDRRPLGRTGLTVSPLGLGTVKFGRRDGVKYPEPVRIPGDRLALALLSQAMELRINLLDTAPAYGSSEERLGLLLEGWRDRWVISTKAGETFENGVSSYDFSYEAVYASIEQSLERLRTDRVEIALIHSDGSDGSILDDGGAIEALKEHKAAKRVGCIGMSPKTVEGAMRAAEVCGVLMLEFNLGNLEMRPVIRRCAELGVGVLVKKGLMSGHAAGGETVGDAQEGVRRSLRLCLSEPGVSSVIVGTVSPEHLDFDARVAAEILAKIREEGVGSGDEIQ